MSCYIVTGEGDGVRPRATRTSGTGGGGTRSGGRGRDRRRGGRRGGGRGQCRESGGEDDFVANKSRYNKDRRSLMIYYGIFERLVTFDWYLGYLLYVTS